MAWTFLEDVNGVSGGTTGTAAASATPGAFTGTGPNGAYTVQNGDVYVLYAVCKGGTSTTTPPTIATPTNWTSQVDAIVNTGQTGSTTAGPIRIRVFTRQYTGTAITAPSVATSSAAQAGICVGWAIMRPGTAADTLSFANTSGSDTTAGTAYSVTGAANPGIQAGDFVFCVTGIAVNLSGMQVDASATLTAAGCTFDTTSEITDSQGGVTSGQRPQLIVTENECTAGSSTAAPVYSSTLATATNTRGGTVFFRMRATSPVSPPVMNAGADVASHPINTAFTRTGSGTNTPTSYTWTINAGPTGVGNVIGSAAALSWTPFAPGTYTLRLSGSNAGGAGTPDDMTITVTGGLSGTEYTALGSTTGGGTTESTDGPLNCGIEFYVTSACQLESVRFYRATTNMNVDHVRVYRVDSISTGTLVAENSAPGTFSGTGWKDVPLTTNPTLTVNQRYRAVVHYTSRYVGTQNYYTTGPASAGITNGPLVIPNAANATGADQNSYVYGATMAFPTEVFNGSNYWVDVAVVQTVQAPTGASAGADPAPILMMDKFTRTGTVSGGGAPTSYQWEVVTAPTGARETAGTILSSTDTIDYMLGAHGVWTLKFTATNAGGSTSATVNVDINGGTGTGNSTRWLLILGDAQNPTANELAQRNRMINTKNWRIQYVDDDDMAERATITTFDAMYITYSAANVGFKYWQISKPVWHGYALHWYQDYWQLTRFINILNLTGNTNVRFTSQYPNLELPVSQTGNQAIFTSGLTEGQNLIQEYSLYNTVGKSEAIIFARHSNNNTGYVAIFGYEQGAFDPMGSDIRGRRICWEHTNWNTLGTTGKAVWDRYMEWLMEPSGVQLNPHGSNNNTDITFQRLMGPAGMTFTRTATEVTNGLTINSRRWWIYDSPIGNAGTTLSTSATVNFTPPTSGSYTLRYEVTTTDGRTHYRDVVIYALGYTTQAYRYYRFQPTQLRTAGTTITQLGEFTFYNGWNKVTTVPTVTNPGGTNPGVELPARAYDQDPYTKWTNTLNPTTAPLVFDFGVTTTITHYDWRTANDATDRDPVSWVVEGSTNGTTWVPFSTVTSEPVNTGRYWLVGPFDVGVPPLYRNDLFTLTETATLLVSNNLTASDTAAFTDVSTLDRFSAVSDTFTGLTETIPSQARGVSDTFFIGDIVIKEETLSKLASETFTWSEIAQLTQNVSLNRSDTFTFTDIALVAASQLLSASDSFAFTDISSLLASLSLTASDTFTFTELVALARASALTDTFTFSEVVALANTLSTSDAVAFSELVALARASALSDTFTATETLSIAVNALLSDIAPFTDTSSLARASALSDTFSFTDATTFLLLASTLSEGIAFTDTTALTQSRDLNASDAFSFTDVSSLQIQTFEFVASDLFALTESTQLTQVLAVATTDTFGSLTELVNLVRASALTDTFDVADTSRLTNSAALSDLFGVFTDAIQILKTTNVTDFVGFGLSESVSELSATLNVTDTEDFTDALALQRASALSDTVSFTDTFTALTANLAVNDLTGLSESVTIALATALTDLFSLTDLSKIAIAATVTDVYGLTETYTAFRGVNPSVNDSFVVTESAAIAVSFARNDTFAFTDTATQTSNQLKTASDTFGLTESASVTVAIARSDAFDVTDTRTGSANATANDTFSPQETVSASVTTKATDNYDFEDTSLVLVEVIRTDSVGFVDTSAQGITVETRDDFDLGFEESHTLAAWLESLETFDFTEEWQSSTEFSASDLFNLTELTKVFIQIGAQWPVDFLKNEVSKTPIDIHDPVVVSHCANPGTGTITKPLVVGADVTKHGILFTTAVVTKQIDTEVD